MQSLTRGTNSTWPYSMGLTLMSTTVGLGPEATSSTSSEEKLPPEQMEEGGLELPCSTRVLEGSNCRSTSRIKALVKLNLEVSKGWQT